MFIAVLKYGDRSIVREDNILVLDTDDLTVEEIKVSDLEYVGVENLLHSGHISIRYKFLRNFMRHCSCPTIQITDECIDVFGVSIRYHNILLDSGVSIYWHIAYFFRFADYIVLRLVTDKLDWLTIVTDFHGELVALWQENGICTNNVVRAKIDTISRI